jgi:hypothetical protein
MRKGFTTDEQKYIRKHRLKMSCRQIADALGCSRTRVQRFLWVKGLQPPIDVIAGFRVKALIGRTSFTTEMDDKIRSEYLVKPIKTIATELGRSYTGVMGRLRAMRLEIPKQIREERKLLGRFQPGIVPANKGKRLEEFMSKEGIRNSKKTRFKKGNLPASAKEKDGVITIRNYRYKSGEIRPYKWIRISLGKWQQYHVYKWEQKFGQVPEGMIIVFKNGDTMDCRYANLELISLADNMRRNTIHRYPEEIKTSIRTIGKLKKTIKKHEK